MSAAEKPLPRRVHITDRLEELQRRLWRARAMTDALAEGLLAESLEDAPAVAQGIMDYLEQLHSDMDVELLLTPKDVAEPSGPDLRIV